MSFLLHFPPLDGREDPLAFPCDAQGQVDLSRLNRRELNSYLYARALVGVGFRAPTVDAYRLRTEGIGMPPHTLQAPGT